MLDPHFVILGFFIAMLGTLAYVVDTIKGKTHPNRVTWFMWTLAPLVAFAAQLSEHVGIQSLQSFGAGFGPLLVLIASFVNRKSVWKITVFDISCGVLSLLGLGLWLITRHGDVAILFAIFADAMAATPTIRKSWTNPETESYQAYLFGGVGALITLLTIDNFTFSNSAFAAYIFFVCSLLTIVIRFKIGVRFRVAAT
jgi:hypothetical protein